MNIKWQYLSNVNWKKKIVFIKRAERKKMFSRKRKLKLFVNVVDAFVSVFVLFVIYSEN